MTQTMSAMVLLRPEDAAGPGAATPPEPEAGELRLRVEACGVCRTDLHLVDGELPRPALPIIPGHEIVGRVEAIGAGVRGFTRGQRIGAPWLGQTCGHCPYCLSARENLCDDPLFTGYTRDGGYATHAIIDASYGFALPQTGEAASSAPLLCAGLIGWRTLKMAGPAQDIGVYGFGAAAHIIAQVAILQGKRVHAFVRPGDEAAAEFALSLGAASRKNRMRRRLSLSMRP